MKIDYRKMNDLIYKSIKLREIASNKDLPIEKSMKIRKQQDEIYKKHKFLKELSKANNRIKKGGNK